MILDTQLERPPTPTAETLRFRDALAALLAAAPPPDAVDIAALRKLRAEGKTALPVHGPLDHAARWLALPTAPGADAVAPGRVRVVDPPSGAAAARGVYVHVHGGGWTLGAPDQFDGRNLAIAEASEAIVISASYRLAPEHPWPACNDDVYAAALFALDLAKGRGLPVVIGGESAGAHLAALTLLRLRDLGRLKEVVGAVLAYGCFDMRGGPSVRNWGPRNLVLSTPIVRWFIGNVLGPNFEHGDPNDPAVSPLLAELSEMPPALFIVGDEDPLIDDTLFMAERWRAAGAAARLQVWPGAVHAFDYFTDPKFNLPIARECVAGQARFLSERFAVRS